VNFELVTDPLVEMDRFRQRAESEGLSLPEAMTLATIGLDGNPRARVVLLKGRRGRELHFYTNYESDKAHELDKNPNAALCIHYPSLAVQTRVAGRDSRLTERESDAYFATRPRDSQLGAWASNQSRPLASRPELDEAMEREQQRFY
jgi:pyridoxamine 5'-phosphate oxidase